MSEPTRFSKILVAVDGSDASMKAAEYGIAMAKKHDAKLLVVNVIFTPASTFTYTTQAWYEEFMKKAKEEIGKFFNKIRKKAEESGVELKTETVDEIYSVPAAIIKYAENKNVDLIVVSSTGKTGFKRLLLGSVASGVVMHSASPVMVIK